MDGIDGIAGGQCVTVAGAAAGLSWAHGQPALAELCALLAAAGLGFLTRNWHPARIFMGDVASGWLGFELAVIALLGEATGAVPFTAFLILMGVCLVDSTWTLLRRLLAGEKVYR